MHDAPPGQPYALTRMRWTGLDAAGDTWEPLDNLTSCEAAIAAFEQPAHSTPGRAAAAARRGAPPPIPVAGCTVTSTRRRRPRATWAGRWWAGRCSTVGPVPR